MNEELSNIILHKDFAYPVIPVNVNSSIFWKAQQRHYKLY